MADSVGNQRSWLGETVRSVKGRRELVEPGKLPGYLYHKLAEEIWRDPFVLDFYKGRGSPLGSALVTTPIQPFFRDPTKYDPRPGKWSKIENARSLSRLGYSADVYDIANQAVGPDEFEQYSVLFGDHQNFVRYATELSDDSLKICYSGGMHRSQLHQAYRSRLDELAERRGVRINATRSSLLEDNPATDLADAIVVMGDEYTAETYRTAGFDGPIHNIHTTHPPGYDFDPGRRDYEQARKNFVWLGGMGPILKGLDRVLEVFARLEDLQLYVCGPIKEAPEFVNLYEKELYDTENIETVGWVDVRSRTFESIVEQCAWHVYPSGSEGSSGAVASTMWRGLAPVVTREVISEVGDWGVALPDADVETIASVVQECAHRDPASVERMVRSSADAARRLYGRDRYSNVIDTILRSILTDAGLPVRE